MFELCCFDRFNSEYKVYTLSEAECKRDWERQLFAYVLELRRTPPQQSGIFSYVRKRLYLWAEDQQRKYWINERPDQPARLYQSHVRKTKLPEIAPYLNGSIPDEIDYYVSYLGQATVCWRSYSKADSVWYHYEYPLEKMIEELPDMLARDVLSDPTWIYSKVIRNTSLACQLVQWVENYTGKHRSKWRYPFTKAKMIIWVSNLNKLPARTQKFRKNYTGRSKQKPTPPRQINLRITQREISLGPVKLDVKYTPAESTSEPRSPPRMKLMRQFVRARTSEITGMSAIVFGKLADRLAKLSQKLRDIEVCDDTMLSGCQADELPCEQRQLPAKDVTDILGGEIEPTSPVFRPTSTKPALTPRKQPVIPTQTNFTLQAFKPINPTTPTVKNTDDIPTPTIKLHPKLTTTQTNQQSTLQPAEPDVSLAQLQLKGTEQITSRLLPKPKLKRQSTIPPATKGRLSKRMGGFRKFILPPHLTNSKFSRINSPVTISDDTVSLADMTSITHLPTPPNSDDDTSDIYNIPSPYGSDDVSIVDQQPMIYTTLSPREKKLQFAKQNVATTTDDSTKTCYLIPDSGADTSSVGGPAWEIDTTSMRNVEVQGFDGKKSSFQIVSAITAVDLPAPVSETVLIRINEATHNTNGNSLLSTYQARDFGISVNDCAISHGGGSYIATKNIVLPLRVEGGLLVLPIRKPTQYELDNYDIHDLTSPKHWKPETKVMEPLSPAAYLDIIENAELEGSVNNCKKFTKPTMATRKIIDEGYTTTTYLSSVTSYEGYNCAQNFKGMKTNHEINYGMVKESEAPLTLFKFFSTHGTPSSLESTTANPALHGSLWMDCLKTYNVNPSPPVKLFNPSYTPKYTSILSMMEAIFEETNCEPEAWFAALMYVQDIRNNTSQRSLYWETPERLHNGKSSNLTNLLKHRFWELVLYLPPKENRQNYNKTYRLGRWLGRDPDPKQTSTGSVVLDVVEWKTKKAMATLPIKDAIDSKLKDLIASTQKSDELRVKQNHIPLEITQLPCSKGTTDYGEHPYAPNDLLNLPIIEDYIDDDGIYHKKKGLVTDKLTPTTYVISFDDDIKLYDYHSVVDLLRYYEGNDEEVWKYTTILNHRFIKGNKKKNRSVEVLVDWADTDTPSWEPLYKVRKDFPGPVLCYALKKGLSHGNAWKWARNFCNKRKKVERYHWRTASQQRAMDRSIRYVNGVRIPRSIHEALDLDKENGNNLWNNAIQNEVMLLTKVYPTFELMDTNDHQLSDYHYVKSDWSLDCDCDGQRNAYLVGKFYYLHDVSYNSCSGMTKFTDIENALLNALMLDLNIVLCTVDKRYQQPSADKQFYTILDSEFGNLAGQKVIIQRGLYGHKMPGSVCHTKLEKGLNALGFASQDIHFGLWSRNEGDHEQYVLVIGDDILIFSRDPYKVVNSLETRHDYTLENPHSAGYLIGDDLVYDDENKRWNWKEYPNDDSVDEERKLYLASYHQHRMVTLRNDHLRMKNDPTYEPANSYHRLFMNLIYDATYTETNGQSPRQSTVYGEYWK